MNFGFFLCLSARGSPPPISALMDFAERSLGCLGVLARAGKAGSVELVGDDLGLGALEGVLAVWSRRCPPIITCTWTMCAR